MKIALNLIGLLLLVIGLIWVLQGANILLGSFMSGQTQWLVIGIVAVLAGVGMLAWANFRGPSPRL